MSDTKYTFNLPLGSTLIAREEPNHSTTIILTTPLGETVWNSGIAFACVTVTAGASLMLIAAALNPATAALVAFLINKGCNKIGEEAYFGNGSGGGGEAGGGGNGGPSGGDEVLLPSTDPTKRDVSYWNPLNQPSNPDESNDADANTALASSPDLASLVGVPAPAF